MKTKFTWNYSIKGMVSFFPLSVTKIAETLEEARAAAQAKIGPDGTLYDPPEIKPLGQQTPP